MVKSIRIIYKISKEYSNSAFQIPVFILNYWFYIVMELINLLFNVFRYIYEPINKLVESYFQTIDNYRFSDYKSFTKDDLTNKFKIHRKLLRCNIYNFRHIYINEINISKHSELAMMRIGIDKRIPKGYNKYMDVYIVYNIKNGELDLVGFIDNKPIKYYDKPSLRGWVDLFNDDFNSVFVKNTIIKI